MTVFMLSRKHLNNCYNNSMKKLFVLLSVLSFSVAAVAAETVLSQVLPLVQQQTRTPLETQKIFYVFRTAQDPDVLFATGASLVRIPPEKTYEPALFNQLVNTEHPLKTAFAAIILTTMGLGYEEFSPILLDALQSDQPILRAYAAGAYGLIRPTDKTYLADVVRLYIFDPALAQRAANALTEDPASLFAILRKYSADTDPQLRAAAAAWLGTLHTPQALAQLDKRARKEKEPSVQTQLAMALAAWPEQALPLATQGLSLNYKKPAATTYDLALGFMTGHSVSALKTAILSTRTNERINALRAAAYMAGVLANPDGFSYSTDRTFDIHLLKGLVPQITALANHGSAEEKKYAQNTLAQIEKLI